MNTQSDDDSTQSDVNVPGNPYTDYNASQAQQRAKMEVEANRRREEKKKVADKTTDFVILCIKHFLNKSAVNKAAYCNVLSRAMGQPYKRDKLKSVDDLNLNVRDLCFLMVIAYFAQVLKACKTETERLKIKSAQMEMSALVMEASAWATPLMVNSSLCSVFNDIEIGIDGVVKEFEQYLESFKNDVNNKMCATFQLPLPSICFDYYFLNTCNPKISKCKKPHVCPEPDCRGAPHFVYNCPSTKMISDYTKSALKDKREYMDKQKRYKMNNNRYNKGQGRYNDRRDRFEWTDRGNRRDRNDGKYDRRNKRG